MMFSKKLGWFNKEKKSKSFEQFIRDNLPKEGEKYSSEFVIKIWQIKEDSVEFYVHPQGRDGETYNFILRNNQIELKKI